MRKIIVLLAAFGFVIVGCGDDSGSSTRTTGGASTTGSGEGTTTTAGTPPVSISGDTNNHGTEDATTSNEVDMEADNFYFGPTFVAVAPGATVTVHLTNEGSVAHNFSVTDTSVDETLQPGDSKDIDVTVPSGGDPVVFFCKFHQNQGMQGAFYFM